MKPLWIAIAAGALGAVIWFGLGKPGAPATPSPESKPAAGVRPNKSADHPPAAPNAKPGTTRDLERIRELAAAICGQHDRMPLQLMAEMKELAAAHPKEAIRAILEALPDSQDWHNATVIAGFALVRISAAERAPWLEAIRSFGNENIRNELLSTSAQYLASASPQEAYDLALKISDETQFNYTAGEVLGTWVKFHPADAPAILSQIDKSEYSSLKVERFAANWASADLPQFTAWVTALEEPAVKNQMIPMVIQGTLEQSDYPRAVTWATSITDPEIRNWALTRIAEIEPGAAAIRAAGLRAGRDFTITGNEDEAGDGE